MYPTPIFAAPLKYMLSSNMVNRFREVAQPGSALVWGARGRWFESSLPDQLKRD